MSNASASAPNSRWSWLAAPISSSTESPARMAQPCLVMSRVRVRCMYWVELWKRITSSTAWGARAGSAARASR